MNYTIMVLAAYAVIMIAATVLMTNKEKSVERFCVGNRNTGWFISALSIAATWIWAPALFTSTENAYTKGFAGLFWFLVPNVLCLIFFIPFARRIRKEMPEGITLSGYMHQKYQSESVKNIYLFQLGALSTLSTGVQLLAGSKILSMLTGIPFWIMTVIMAVIAYSYSQFSGIKASILTDSIQMVFMLIASVCFAVFGIKNGGGLQNMFAGIGGYTGECSSLFSAKGIEIARYGSDETVIAKNVGGRITLPVSFRGQSLMTTVGKIVQLYRQAITEFPRYRGKIYINIDDCGLGGGVTDRLEEVKQEEKLTRMVIVPVNAAGKVPEETLGDGKQKACDIYDNMTTYLWGTVKDALMMEEVSLERVTAISMQLMTLQSSHSMRERALMIRERELQLIRSARMQKRLVIQHLLVRK